MSKLTSERVNGIKTGYWSPAKKDELVQRLGAIEQQSGRLISQVCDYCCRHPREISEEKGETLDAICDSCPLSDLERLIDGQE